MENVNKQLLDAAKAMESCNWSGVPIGNKAVIAQAVKLLQSQAIAAAEQAPRWPQVDMGFGKFAVGSCTCAVTGVPGLLYLRLDEPRPHNTDCSDVFPVGSEAPEDRIASVIHFHSAQALQQTIDELLQIQREHYTAAEQAQQAEPVAWKHDCAALLMNDVELWVRNCPHCGKPRAAQPPAVDVPDGYALVPIEPTAQMVDAGFGRDDDNCKFWLHPAQAYRAMLAAAQKGGE